MLFNLESFMPASRLSIHLDNLGVQKLNELARTTPDCHEADEFTRKWRAIEEELGAELSSGSLEINLSILFV